MNKIKKYKFIYITIFIFILTLSFMNKSYSSEIEEVVLVECSKSSAYLEWEKLSDEEKEKVINKILPRNEKQIMIEEEEIEPKENRIYIS